MRFSFDKNDLSPITKGEANCFLLTDGLGGYCSLTHAGSVARGDQALLMCSKKAPGDRWHMLTNINEILVINGRSFMLSSQRYDFGLNDSDHTSCLSSFEFDGYPVWKYRINGVLLKKSIVMAYGHNTVSVRYELSAPAGTTVSLKAVPIYRITPKNEPFVEITDTSVIRIRTNGTIKEKSAAKTPSLYFSQDERDGRAASGKCFTDKIISFDDLSVPGEIVFSTEEFSSDVPSTFDEVLSSAHEHSSKIVSQAGLKGEITTELLRASDDDRLYEILTSMFGVGKKVANCIMLFALARTSRFPIDVWIDRILKKYYGGAFDTSRYPDTAGIMQQYMFYYERNDSLHTT